jgi:hypothetical protein
MLGLSTRSSLLASLIAGCLSVGCVDPDGDYEEFQEREKKTVLPSGTGCGDPGAECTPAKVGDLDGQWLFALAATLAPAKPVLFFADITTKDSGGLVGWTFTLTPLDAKTRVPLAPLPTLAETTIPADGNWSADLEPLTVPGAANPITLGSEIVADTALTGKVCGGRDFLCGDVTGEVTKPLKLSLDGSTWTMARLKTKDTLPEKIYVNCTCTEAGPPPG